MSSNFKRQLESSMSIPVYEGSMLSIRAPSSNPPILRSKTGKTNQNEIYEA